MSDWLCSAAKVMKPLFAGPLIGMGGTVDGCEYGSNCSQIATNYTEIDIISVHRFVNESA